MNQISIGNAIPDFEALSTGNKTVKLTDYRGRYIVIYFYPKDNTPGCTHEGQGFRDNIDKFTALNAVILGVSRDTVRVHEGFNESRNSRLICFQTKMKSCAKLFDVIKMKNMYGKQVRGIER